MKHYSVVHLWSDYYINADGNPHPYLKEKKHSSAVVAATVITDSETLPTDVFGNQVKIINKATPNSLLTRIKNRLMYYFFWQKTNIWAGKKIKSLKPNILHVHFGYTAVRMLPVIKKSNLPVVLTFYGVDASTMIADAKWVEEYKKAFKYVLYIVVLSEVVKDRMMNLGFEGTKIMVWNIPIKLDTYVYRKKERSATTKFITAARFVEKKGYPYLIAAFKKVHTVYPDTTLSIIGYGPGKTKIDAEIKKHELEGVVTVTDTNLRTDFHQFYYQQLCEHDIFVLPSTTSKDGDDEGGPALTLVSAQAAGLPVICTPFVGSEITIFDGVTGILCNQDDSDSIAEKMIYLMNNPSDCDRLGKAASELVHPLFAREMQMERVMDVYNKLIE